MKDRLKILIDTPKKRVAAFSCLIVLTALLVSSQFYTLTGQPFAVYSETDQSLTFYDRLVRPKDGASYDGRTATYVYSNVNTKPQYEGSGYLVDEEKDWVYGDFKKNVLSVSFADEVSFDDCGDLFYNLKTCESFDLRNLNTTGCSDFSGMFSWCESVEEMDLSGLDFSSGTDFSHMFYECGKLESIEMRRADLSSGESFKQMFDECTSLSSLSLDNSDFGAGVNFHYMFNNCRNLAFDCSAWNAPNASDAVNFAADAPGVSEPIWPADCDVEPYSPSYHNSAAKDADICKVSGCTNSKKNKCGYCNSHHLDNCDDPYCSVDKCKEPGCDNPGNLNDGYCNNHHYEKARQDQEEDYIGGNTGTCKKPYCYNDAYRKGYCRQHYID